MKRKLLEEAFFSVSFLTLQPKQEAGHSLTFKKLKRKVKRISLFHTKTVIPKQVE